MKYLGRGLANLSKYVHQRSVRWSMIAPEGSSIGSQMLRACNRYLGRRVHVGSSQKGKIYDAKNL